ncbi:MAG: sigma-70 family RNA polymerase sigma factor [Oscillatoriales cyanobacterium C42_A2020_001]|nr:sigma-70 family RNA polymerase sigma factor [Leptolyngbyaceae cyanobacterium C42_A2020_001]
MQPRQEITEIFSTFLQFEAEHLSRWVTDRQLRRNMKKCLEDFSRCGSTPVSRNYSSERFWALYWFYCWQTQKESLAEGHLSAYLQEPCYWAAQSTARKFTNVQFGISDYCQLAIAEVRTILKGYNPERGADLKTFASVAFPRVLKDILRQRQEANLCTNLALLRRVSKKRLVEALRQAGLSTTAIAQYRLARVCFNALSGQPQTDSQQLPTGDRDLWVAISTLYNTERRNQLEPSTPDCSPETIERWLNQCATWVRAYLYPPVESLNAAKPGLESNNEMQDTLADPTQGSLLTELVMQEEQQERQKQQFQLRDQIVSVIKKLDTQSQELLRLYYQQGLTQQQIMQQLQMSQATVSRRLTKAREAVLMALVQWSQEALNNRPVGK